MNKLEVLKINVSPKEFDTNERLREKIDDFCTAVNDRLIEKYAEQMSFDAQFVDDKMVFTLDSPQALNETCKTIDKLLKDKKFASLGLRKVDQEECSCEYINVM